MPKFKIAALITVEAIDAEHARERVIEALDTAPEIDTFDVDNEHSAERYELWLKGVDQKPTVDEMKERVERARKRRKRRRV